MEKLITIPLFNEPELPVLKVKIDKTPSGPPLFSISLKAIWEDSSVEICRIDNYDFEKKGYHIHRHKHNEEDKIGKPFKEIADLDTGHIGVCINYLTDNWRKIYCAYGGK